MMAQAKTINILVIKVKNMFSLFPSRCFLKQIENMTPCFYRVIETPVKVLENSKKLWKYAALVPTAFLVLQTSTCQAVRSVKELSADSCPAEI